MLNLEKFGFCLTFPFSDRLNDSTASSKHISTAEMVKRSTNYYSLCHRILSISTLFISFSVFFSSFNTFRTLIFQLVVCTFVKFALPFKLFSTAYVEDNFFQIIIQWVTHSLSTVFISVSLFHSVIGQMIPLQAVSTFPHHSWSKDRQNITLSLEYSYFFMFLFRFISLSFFLFCYVLELIYFSV